MEAFSFAILQIFSFSPFSAFSPFIFVVSFAAARADVTRCVTWAREVAKETAMFAKEQKPRGS